MKNKALYMALVVVVVIATVVLQGFLSLWSIRLNLTILPVYFISLKKGTTQGTATALVAGLLEDLLSGGLVGPSLLSKGLSGIIVANIPAVFYYWRPLIGLASMFLITIFDDIVVYICLGIYSGQPVPFGDFVPLALGRALFNAPFGLVFRYRTNE